MKTEANNAIVSLVSFYASELNEARTEIERESSARAYADRRVDELSEIIRTGKAENARLVQRVTELEGSLATAETRTKSAEHIADRLNHGFEVQNEERRRLLCEIESMRRDVERARAAPPRRRLEILDEMIENWSEDCDDE